MRRLILNLHPAAAAAFAGLLLCVVGCRHADANRELVERELRLQEDELYRLHDEIAQREKLLEGVRRENAGLKRELEQTRGGMAAPLETGPVMPPAPPDLPPDRAPRPGSGVPPIEAVPPKIEVPGLEGPPPAAPGAGRSSWKATRGIRRASFDQPSDDSNESSDDQPTDNRVAKIVLNRRLTGGYNADHRLGDEGIMIVIEPRNKDDRIVSRAGDVSVVVVDPALSGADARVARWDFTADEIMRLDGKTPLGEGIHLDLRWPMRPPEHERLMLFARFTTADGESHEASQPILVDLASDSPGAGATPR